jgi:2-amino-4-hydroxy-6-hydroxymethyldihydropteridine diphosphokinase
LVERFGPLRLSPVYESAAEGFVGAPFLNLVAGFETKLSVSELREELRAIEAANGRERDGPRFAPRTLDLDLLTYGDQIGEVEGYRLPRDEILTYAFVLGPLADVAPQERHPSDGRTYAALWDALSPGWPSLRPYPLALEDPSKKRG